uniref:PHD-type domain-containing protein n=1 Tax=Amphimedon queenslandica TaxID=400682 RepID=A0A1X7SYK2_AMPQE
MGKNTRKITEINKRHKVASDHQEQSTIHQIRESVWEVKSLSKKDGTIYVMEKKLDQCSCKLRCSSCDICTHIAGTVCVTNSTEIDEEKSDVCSSEHDPFWDDSDDEMTTDDESIKLMTRSLILKITHAADVNKKKEKVEDLTQNLLLLIRPCTDTDVLQTVQEHLKSAISVLKAKTEQCHRRKDKKKSKNRWAKPTEKEEKRALSKLKKADINVCCVCWKEDDYNEDTNEDVNWVECDSCKAWLHLYCSIKANSSEEDCSDCYYCKNCSS